MSNAIEQEKKPSEIGGEQSQQQPIGQEKKAEEQPAQGKEGAEIHHLEHRRTGARGTAAMDPQTRKEVARKGGLAVSRNRQHMSEIGRKGGQSVSKNREHMAKIGRKGGAASRGGAGGSGGAGEQQG
jgi:general stress protein YciG